MEAWVNHVIDALFMHYIMLHVFMHYIMLHVKWQDASLFFNKSA